MTYAAALRVLAELLLELAAELERSDGRVLCPRCKVPARLGVMGDGVLYRCPRCGDLRRPPE